jgi:simple sugar transport system permease protein
MGNFFSALGDIATNESAYRNAVIAAAVLLFAACGELVAEKAGTINISLEAMMLAGFVLGGDRRAPHRLDVGRLLFAMLAGLIVAAIQANMSHRLPADQFVVGLVLNVLVLGLVGFLTGSIQPKSGVVRRVSVPVLSRIPLLGPALFDAPWVLYFIFPLVPLVWWLLYRTRWGLEIRAVGEDPNASDVSGSARQQVAPAGHLLHGIVAGFGGGYFLFARAGKFEDSLIGGRGFIAIAAVIFGGWTLKGTVAGCVMFGLVGSFVLTIPSLGYKSIDSSFLAMAPNVITIIAMAVFAKRVRQPAALARPFIRGLK